MKIAIIGLWHLGAVTAACLADAGHEVVAYDGDAAVVARLSRGEAVVHEPGLDECLRRGIDRGLLRATSDLQDAVNGADIIWITWDTPILPDDVADVEWVVAGTRDVIRAAHGGQLMLISSQLPVGTVDRLERWSAASGAGGVTFGCVPENLRLGTALDSFTKPARVVVGLRQASDRARVEALLFPFTDRIEWMSVESAEMTKHALNAFLATTVAFANEIARLCETTGADGSEVARGLKSDPRIGPRAYLSPGGGFAGGTLGRDVAFLRGLGATLGESLDLIPAVAASNTRHLQWAGRRLTMLLGDLSTRTIAVWGLTYKPGTDTLRGSAAVALIEWLSVRGAAVRVYDPAVKSLPRELDAACVRCASPIEAAAGADALVVATAWPEFREVDGEAVRGAMKQARVLDENRFLAATFAGRDGIEFITVGAPISPRPAGVRDGR